MGVVILAGPSGSGKSHLAARLGWTVLRLDDFYRDADEPDMPRSSLGIVDWDDVESWNADRRGRRHQGALRGRRHRGAGL